MRILVRICIGEGSHAIFNQHHLALGLVRRQGAVNLLHEELQPLVDSLDDTVIANKIGEEAKNVMSEDWFSALCGAFAYTEIWVRTLLEWG